LNAACNSGSRYRNASSAAAAWRSRTVVRRVSTTVATAAPAEITAPTGDTFPDVSATSLPDPVHSGLRCGLVAVVLPAGLLVADLAFDRGQRVRVQSVRNQIDLQRGGLPSPAVIDALGLVEVSVGL